MSKLSIVDLEFCESQLSSESIKKVAGGLSQSKTVRSGTGYSEWSSSYTTGYTVDKKSGKVSYGVAYGVAAAVSDTGEVGAGTGSGVTVG